MFSRLLSLYLWLLMSRHVATSLTDHASWAAPGPGATRAAPDPGIRSLSMTTPSPSPLKKSPVLTPDGRRSSFSSDDAESVVEWALVSSSVSLVLVIFLFTCGNGKRTPSSQEEPDPLDKLTLIDDAHAGNRYGATDDGEGETASSASPEMLAFIQVGSSDPKRE